MDIEEGSENSIRFCLLRKYLITTIQQLVRNQASKCYFLKSKTLQFQLLLEKCNYYNYSYISPKVIFLLLQLHFHYI